MRSPRDQGSTSIEFALVLLVLMTFVLGIVDFSRMLFTWNAATEATRLGARYAVVCDDTTRQDAVLARMRQVLPQISAASVQWLPQGCTPDSCQGVNVGITGLKFHWISPIAGAAAPLLPMPSFSTYLPRESMRQDPNSNTACS
ncbi:MAG TPA: TadE family protein [Ramlibacter sp.]